MLKDPEKEVDIRWFIVALLVPLILLSYVPNLKTLTIFSQIANVLMVCTIGITGYYIFTGEPLKNPVDLPQRAPWRDIPEFFSIVIFAMECIGVVSFDAILKTNFVFWFPLGCEYFAQCFNELWSQIMPLENNMLTPKKMLGTYGVLNKGMVAVSVIYFFFGLIGYLKYGTGVHSVITLDLPEKEM